jgi:hypothetical protein
MLLRKSKLFWLLLLSSWLIMPLPASAHTVKTAANVAATFHLEPHHNPRAGEAARVWFALTKVGGELIPLSDCDCQLTIRQGGQLIQQAVLQSIDVEQYHGIPASDLIFPKVGIYTVELSGKAKVGDAFAPFKLQYDVTVQPGQINHIPPTAATPTPQGQNQAWLWFMGGTIGTLATIGRIIWQKRRPASLPMPRD